MKINIKPKNKDGQRHGYWEHHFSNGNLSSKGNFINDNKDGYWELYYTNGQLYLKQYYI